MSNTAEITVKLHATADAKSIADKLRAFLASEYPDRYFSGIIVDTEGASVHIEPNREGFRTLTAEERWGEWYAPGSLVYDADRPRRGRPFFT